MLTTSAIVELCSRTLTGIVAILYWGGRRFGAASSDLVGVFLPTSNEVAAVYGAEVIPLG